MLVFIRILHSPLFIEISSSKFRAFKTKDKTFVFEKKVFKIEIRKERINHAESLTIHSKNSIPTYQHVQAVIDIHTRQNCHPKNGGLKV
jgi:hypothetical protein